MKVVFKYLAILVVGAVVGFAASKCPVLNKLGSAPKCSDKNCVVTDKCCDPCKCCDHCVCPGCCTK